MKYKSLHNDGKRLRRSTNNNCEWCGIEIQCQQLVVVRHYKLGNDYRCESMHLTCYDKARAYCAEHGHTFVRFNMRPIDAISFNFDPKAIKWIMENFRQDNLHVKYAQAVSERHDDTMEPIL